MTAITNAAGSVVMEVDATSNAARTTPYATDGSAVAVPANSQPSNVGVMVSGGVNDNSVVPLRVDRIGSVASSLLNLLMQDSFEGTTIHAGRWVTTATTMAATQSTVQGILFNSGSITTINTGYMLQSIRRFQKMQRSPLQARYRAKLAAVNNSVMELGFGDASTFNGTNGAGAYWQMTAAGVLQPTICFNNTEVFGSDIRSSIDITKFYTFDVIMDDDSVLFTCQDSSTGALVSRQEMQLPLTGARLISATQISALARLYNTGTAPASAPQLQLTDAFVGHLDLMTNRPWADQMSANARTGWENPFTGAQYQAWANSAEPASATLSNTAAGYSVLGGKFQFAAVAGAVTDYALFAIAIPTPANFVVTGIDIESWNTGAAVATTPTLLTWALGYGSTAVSLATGGIVRVPIGAQSFPVGAAIGAKAERISKTFRTAITIPSGRFLHVILRMPVGTATASQVIAGMVNIEGYFD